MVPPSSHGVSRVPRYSGYSQLLSSFAYVTLTLFGMLSHTFQLDYTILFTVQNPICIATHGLASSAFARHYSQNLG